MFVVLVDPLIQTKSQPKIVATLKRGNHPLEELWRDEIVGTKNVEIARLLRIRQRTVHVTEQTEVALVLNELAFHCRELAHDFLSSVRGTIIQNDKPVGPPGLIRNRLQRA